MISCLHCQKLQLTPGPTTQASSFTYYSMSKDYLKLFFRLRPLNFKVAREIFDLVPIFSC